MIKYLILILIIPVLAFGQASFDENRVTREISCKDSTTANAKVVSSFPYAEPYYNNTTKTLEFKVNEVGPRESWRLVHDGKKVITVFFSKGITSSIYYIFQADSGAKCTEEINRLKLIDEREPWEKEELREKSK